MSAAPKCVRSVGKIVSNATYNDLVDMYRRDMETIGTPSIEFGQAALATVLQLEGSKALLDYQHALLKETLNRVQLCKYCSNWAAHSPWCSKTEKVMKGSDSCEQWKA